MSPKKNAICNAELAERIENQVDKMEIDEVYTKLQDWGGTNIDHPDQWLDDMWPDLDSELRTELIDHLIDHLTKEGDSNDAN